MDHLTTGAKGIVNRGSVVPKPGTLMKVPTSATAQLVPLQVRLFSTFGLSIELYPQK